MQKIALFDEIRNIPYCDFSGDAETSEFASFHKITWVVECCWSSLGKQRRLRCHSHSCGAEARQILVENSKIIIFRCFFGHLEQRVDISKCNILYTVISWKITRARMLSMGLNGESTNEMMDIQQYTVSSSWRECSRKTIDDQFQASMGTSSHMNVPTKPPFD